VLHPLEVIAPPGVGQVVQAPNYDSSWEGTSGGSAFASGDPTTGIINTEVSGEASAAAGIVLSVVAQSSEEVIWVQPFLVITYSWNLTGGPFWLTANSEGTCRVAVLAYDGSRTQIGTPIDVTFPVCSASQSNFLQQSSGGSLTYPLLFPFTVTGGASYEVWVLANNSSGAAPNTTADSLLRVNVASITINGLG
jgi:hypothetical protein